MKLTLAGKRYAIDVGQDMEKIKASDDYFYDIRKEQHNGLTERLDQVPGVTFVHYEYKEKVILIDMTVQEHFAETHEIILGIISTAIARGAVLLTAYAEIGT